MSNDRHLTPHPAVSRRALIGAGAALGALPLAGTRPAGAQDGTPAAPPTPPREAITVILAAEPPVLDPVRTYTIDGWSIVHSVYDTLVFRAADGTIQPLLAESWSEPDPLTIEFRLRTGVSFHNGETFDSRSVVASVAHMHDPETASQVAADFSTIQAVEAVDATTVRFRLSQPSPALLGQVAVYLGMLPPDYVADPTNEFGANAPVGTGPYRFVSWERGQQLTLEANPDYVATPAKGAAMAATATFRFAGDPSTRVADLLAGTADLVRDVPQDQVESVDGSGVATTLVAPVAGMAFVRIINATQPWANVEIRRAANLAVDVDSIIQNLLGGRGQRMATMLTPESIGYDPDLAPYEYDPEGAREIMERADPEESYEAIIQITAGASQEAAEAIAAQLVEIGIPATVDVVDQTTFNEDWKNEDVAMRMLSWRPLFDPQSLFSLMFTTFGFLSLHSDTDLDDMIAMAGTDPDPESRAERFREIGRIMHDNPPAIFLWNLTAVYGVSNGLTGWVPRPDEYILPLQAQAG
ncbi:MAG TPA: ABC transporter substrate-binding protein [Thermomicrobiales bacterium]|nr:ABC transporter substrate-binding protein [Thermomicrobiales bacterium]